MEMVYEEKEEKNIKKKVLILPGKRKKVEEKGSKGSTKVAYFNAI